MAKQVDTKKARQIAKTLGHSSVAITALYARRMAQIEHPTGEPVRTGPVQIGAERGWFVREPSITPSGAHGGRPLPRLLRMAAGYLEQASGVVSDMGCPPGKSRAPSCAKQMRELADLLHASCHPGQPVSLDSSRSCGKFRQPVGLVA